MSRPTTPSPIGSQIRFYGRSGVSHTSKTAAFEDVKAKGKRIFDNDLYDIYQMNTYSVLLDVLGDNDVYTVYINDRARVNKYDQNTPMMWQCTCMWADWAFNRINYHGRICSHVYCGYLLLREVKKMSKVANEDNAEVEETLDPFLGQEFESAGEELLFNVVYELVSEDFEAFYDYIMDGYATHSVSEAITDTMADYELEYEDVEEIIKLCLMQFQDNIYLNPANHVEALEAEVLREELAENGVPMNDYDELLDSELFDEIEEEKTSRRTSSIKRAGRIFTEEEKIALIEEDGVSWHVKNKMFG